MRQPEHGLPGEHRPFAVLGPTQYIADEGITPGWKEKPWIVCVDRVTEPKSFILSAPWLASQFAVKNRLPCTVTGADVVSAKSIA